MLAAHEERFQRIYTDYRDRPSGDYAELLRRGEVMSREGVDPEEWRAEIRRKARQDKVHVMTRDSERCERRTRFAPEGEAGWSRTKRVARVTRR
jgi:hypothetical protein